MSSSWFQNDSLTKSFENRNLNLEKDTHFGNSPACQRILVWKKTDNFGGVSGKNRGVSSKFCNVSDKFRAVSDKHANTKKYKTNPIEAGLNLIYSPKTKKITEFTYIFIFCDFRHEKWMQKMENEPFGAAGRLYRVNGTQTRPS